jgi:hypothetical protein
MNWERRRNGRYYYEARKVGGRVVKRYVGRGPAAEWAAERAAAARAARADRHAAAAAALAGLAAADAALDALDALGETLARAALRGAGYHRRHRGEWRKRRGDGDRDAQP